MYKSLRYENIPIGIESIHPWYFEDAPLGGRIAPSMIFDNDTLCTDRHG
jgi:hypothetical protein